MSGSERDAGAATVVVLGLAAVVVLLGAVLVALGAVSVTRHRAAAAADLGALAAASRALQGEPVACSRASGVVQAAGARLASCQVVGDRVEVEVVLQPEGPLAALGEARGRAVAGPAP